MSHTGRLIFVLLLLLLLTSPNQTIVVCDKTRVINLDTVCSLNHLQADTII